MIILIFIITHHKYYAKNNSYNNDTYYKKAYQASNRLEKVGAKYRDKFIKSQIKFEYCYLIFKEYRRLFFKLPQKSTRLLGRENARFGLGIQVYV